MVPFIPMKIQDTTYQAFYQRGKCETWNGAWK